MTMLIHAQLYTDHFTFDAYAPTEAEAEAEALLKAGTQKHCQQYEVDHQEFWQHFGEGIEYRAIRTGLFTRDGEEVVLS